MGYTTTFRGKFKLDRPMKVEHAAYINKFSDTRRMKRDPKKAEALSDPIRLAADLPIGQDGQFFVGGRGFAGQDRDDSILEYNDPPRTQPGLWCQWVVSGSGQFIQWNRGEKFYDYTAWLQYICDNFLKRWGYVLNGQVTWRGEDHGDIGLLEVIDNEVVAHHGRTATVDAPTEGTVKLTVSLPRKLVESYDEVRGLDDAYKIADAVAKVHKDRP
jgi:hypothetical protein